MAIILCKIQTMYKIQNPNGRVGGFHIMNGYYNNPKSKIQDPTPKIQTARLEFGFWIWDGCGEGHEADEDAWPSRPRRPSLQPEGARLGSPRARPKLGTDVQTRLCWKTRFGFQRRGNWGLLFRKRWASLAWQNGGSRGPTL